MPGIPMIGNDGGCDDGGNKGSLGLDILMLGGTTGIDSGSGGTCMSGICELFMGGKGGRG